MEEGAKQVEKPEPQNIIQNEIAIEEDANFKKYSDDILLISNLLDKNTGTIIDEKKGSMYKYCDKIKYFNKRGTKLNDDKNYQDMVTILSEYVKIDGCIFLLFEKLGIFLLKVLVNGYINCEEQNINILSILKKVIHLMLNNEYLSYIYKKFSKIFRLDLKDNESEENIKKIF